MKDYKRKITDEEAMRLLIGGRTGKSLISEYVIGCKRIRDIRKKINGLCSSDGCNESAIPRLGNTKLCKSCLNPEIDGDIDEEKIRSLMSAVLLLAYKDVQNMPGKQLEKGCKTQNPDYISALERKNSLGNDAMRWMLYNNKDSVFSFRVICEHLGISHTKCLAKAHKAYEEANGRKFGSGKNEQRTAGDQDSGSIDKI
jgi:hypothetical protein